MKQNKKTGVQSWGVGVLATFILAILVGVITHQTGLFYRTSDLLSCSPPLGRLLEGKVGRVFSLAYESNSKSDFGNLFSQKNTTTGMSQSVQLKFKADWFTAMLAQSKDRYLLVNSLRNPQLSLIHNQAVSPEQEKEISSQLSKNFYLELNAQGEVLSLQASPELTTVEKNILRWVVAHFQTVFPKRVDSSLKEWVTSEFDPNGRYEATYQVSELAQGSFKLAKTKNKYLELSSYQRQSKRHRNELKLPVRMDVQSKTEGQYDCSLTAFKTLSGDESSKTVISDNEIAGTQDHFTLTFKAEAPFSGVEKGTILAEYNAMSSQKSTFKLVSDESVEEMEKLIQKTELGNLTEKDLLKMLATAKKSGDRKDVDALYLKFKALIYLHPESAAKLGEILAVEDPRSQTMMTLATALSTVGSPEAQQALVSSLNARADNVAAVEVLVPALGMTDHPTQASEDLLKNLVKNSQQEDIITTAGLSLGVMASHLGDNDPERGKRIVNGFLNDYQNADSISQKTLLVSALGNAGFSESLPLLNSALQSNDPALQSEAAMAMRFVPDREVDNTLLKVLSDNPNENVRRAAASSLGFREPTQELSEKLRGVFANQPSEWVRRDLVKNIYEFRTVDPQVKEWLRGVQANDPSPEVRQMAKSYVDL